LRKQANGTVVVVGPSAGGVEALQRIIDLRGGTART
jgi:chemotaxis response regulator CheB